MVKNSWWVQPDGTYFHVFEKQDGGLFGGFIYDNRGAYKGQQVLHGEQFGGLHRIKRKGIPRRVMRRVEGV